MAKKKPASQIRPHRNRNAQRVARRVDPDLLRELIEAERYRLMRAEAVLHCVLVALDDDDSGRTDAPHFHSAIDVARDLIKQSINQLDAVELPLVEEADAEAVLVTTRENDQAAESTNEVKEHALKYVH
jgi:hypothetical protein